MILSYLFAALALATGILLIHLGYDLLWNEVFGDSWQYISIASNLAENGIFSLDGETLTARRELLYPLFLSVFME